MSVRASVAVQDTCGITVVAQAGGNEPAKLPAALQRAGAEGWDAEAMDPMVRGQPR